MMPLLSRGAIYTPVISKIKPVWVALLLVPVRSENASLKLT